MMLGTCERSVEGGEPCAPNAGSDQRQNGTSGRQPADDDGMEQSEASQVDPRRVIEKALWGQGVTGERCALVAHAVLSALVEAGLIAPETLA